MWNGDKQRVSFRYEESGASSVRRVNLGGCFIDVCISLLDDVDLSSATDRIVAKIDISGDPDDVFYDGKRHRIYAICGAGKIDIIEQTDPNTYAASARVNT